MSQAEKFDYRRFVELSGESFLRYMEKLDFDRHTKSISPADVSQMATDLNSFDDDHLVYAIMLGESQLPRFRLKTHSGQNRRK
jgi:hypothetical protein